MGTMRDLEKKGRQEDKEDFEDEWKLVIDGRHRFSGHTVTLNAKLGRIVISSACYKYVVEKLGKEFDAVLLLASVKSPGMFLIRPCDKDDEGSRKIHMAAGSRVISAKLLLQELNFKAPTGVHFKAEWKDNLKALMIDINEPLEKN